MKKYTPLVITLVAIIWIISMIPFSMEITSYIVQKSISKDVKKQSIQILKKEEIKSGTGVFVFFWDSHRGRGFTYYEKQDSKYKENTLADLTKKDGKYKKFLSGADEIIINLETAVSEISECYNSWKSVQISMLPSNLKTLTDIGGTVVNTANNHSYDCWVNSYKRAKTYISDAWLKQFGDGRGEESVIYTGSYDGEKFAFFWFEWIETKPDRNEKIKKVKEYSEAWYLPVVNLHWGIEYSSSHTEFQKNLAYRFIDEANARLIVWHHPHVVADKEIYKWIPIYYSIGNFLFDQPFENTLKWLWIKCFISQKNSSCEELEFKREKEKYKIVVD
jgi:poly-gamma-glutamate capsule biosynthesis protein CapA/YwtB (metallophosphatase superfamily)